jgi:drug/metabolite transporter (DMT)-like permease
MMRTGLRTGPAAALASALLFGATTPIAKHYLQEAAPLLVAGLLYVGSGLGLALWRTIQDGGWRSPGLTGSEWGWLIAATAVGGIAAPALLMWGLVRSDAATASLFLNLETVFTATLAWLIFREATGGRVVAGFLAIFLGGVLLAWPSSHIESSHRLAGLASVAAACLCWGIDNNLTRKISASDPRLIAGVKGLAAGTTNTLLALFLGARLPAAAHLVGLLSLGFLGYGLSLVLFIVALRHLGSARTGAYFATAPFIGALLAGAVYGEPAGALFYVACGLMAIGVWLHLTEHHEHEHVHEELTHAHSHSHDEHHRHAHEEEWDGLEPHTHLHRHAPMRHTHAHFPDIHHEHRHG